MNSQISSWNILATKSPVLNDYLKSLAATLQKVGCTTEAAPYVAAGLLQQLKQSFPNGSPYPAGIAAAFLNDASCVGAQGVSAENKAELQELAENAQP